MQLSIVTTLYYSAPYLQEFCSRITKEAERITNDYEIILVNDGSPDESLEVAITLHESAPHYVKVIDLSRNFGHHKAMMTGLTYAQGDLVFLIDVDLEEEPELLGTFYSAFKEHNPDVVFGVQKLRRGSLFSKWSGNLFYFLFNLLSDYKLPKNLTTVRLMSRRYVDSLIVCREREVIIAGLWEFVGFTQLPLPIEKLNRTKSTYAIGKRLAYFIMSIAAFSNKPLIYIAYLGIGILGPSSLYVLYLIALRLFLGKPPSGFTTLVVSIWLLGGLTIFSLGVTAIYLSVIFSETKHRPYTIIRGIHERHERNSSRPLN